LENAHTRPILLTAAAVTAGLLLASPAAADSFQGTLDGKAHTWHILETDGRSTASFSVLPHGTTFTIQGHADEDRGFSTKGTLAINFTQDDEGQMLSEPEVTFFPSDGLFPNYSSDGSGDWELNTLDIDGDTASIVGTFHGTLNKVEAPGSDADAEDAIEVELEFDVTARRQEL